MTEEELIASGKLELYVCGALPSEEIQEVEEVIASSPELTREVEEIEASLIGLAEAVAPPLNVMVWTSVLNSIRKVRTINDISQKTTNWAAITGWAAAFIAAGGIFWMMQQNNVLEQDVQITTVENTQLKEKIKITEGELSEANDILAVIGSKDYSTIPLPGNQAVAPNAYAKVYYNKDQQVAYVDAAGLPTPPKGKVYQVWSLTLDPLTPTSMGLIEGMTDTEKGIFKFENIPGSEAFGITLEPAGGSETPTLSQLYTLGTVGS
jgi:anti-sigma-K factor RskA